MEQMLVHLDVRITIFIKMDNVFHPAHLALLVEVLRLLKLRTVTNDRFLASI